MREVENKILSFLESGHKISTIIKELNIDDESLADVIIELDAKGLVSLDNKKWVLTKKGKGVLQEMKELLRDLKLEYMHGNIDRDEFWKKRKELEVAIVTEKPKQDDVKEKNMRCPKCEKDNNVGSKYCYKCGIPLGDT